MCLIFLIAGTVNTTAAYARNRQMSTLPESWSGPSGIPLPATKRSGRVAPEWSNSQEQKEQEECILASSSPLTMPSLPGLRTISQMISDTLELTRILRHCFGKEKIYLMGHSGGSFIGIHAVARAPELYHAYRGRTSRN